MSVDPLAKKYPNRLPYEYTFSNPVNLTAPTRMAPVPSDYIRLVFYGGARKSSHNYTFQHAANNVVNDYSDFNVKPQRFVSAEDIIVLINSKKDNSIQSIDIVSHGGTHAIYSGESRFLADKNNSLYDTNARQILEGAWTDGGDIGEISYQKFTNSAKIELHGCNTASNYEDGGSNIVSELSKKLYGAGKTHSVVIDHSTSANPNINGEPVRNKNGTITSGTKNSEQDYRQGTRVIYHNGEVLFTTQKKVEFQQVK